MSWNFDSPLPVNCMRTIGALLCGSMSAWVPESLRSLPVICGIGFVASVGWYFIR